MAEKSRGLFKIFPRSRLFSIGSHDVRFDRHPDCMTAFRIVEACVNHSRDKIIMRHIREVTTFPNVALKLKLLIQKKHL